MPSEMVEVGDLIASNIAKAYPRFVMQAFPDAA